MKCIMPLTFFKVSGHSAHPYEQKFIWFFANFTLRFFTMNSNQECESGYDNKTQAHSLAHTLVSYQMTCLTLTAFSVSAQYAGWSVSVTSSNSFYPQRFRNQQSWNDPCLAILTFILSLRLILVFPLVLLENSLTLTSKKN